MWPFSKLDTILQNQQIILGLLKQILAKETKMAVDLTAITTEVANQTTVDASIEQLVANLAAQLAAIAAG